LTLAAPPVARERDPVVTLLIVIVAVRIATLLYTLWHGQPLTWDEIEFYRASDFVRRGLLPYRDFWEHHAPLQWFLFAPFTALTGSPGVSAVLLMRVAQLPLWLATVALLAVWIRRSGFDRFARSTAIALLLLDGPFVFQALEFRIDALSTCLFIAAIVVGLDARDSGRRAFACGALLALSGIANLRVMPIALLAGLLLVLIDLREKRWRVRASGAWIAGGGAVVCILTMLFFFARGAAQAAYRYGVADNVLTERMVVPAPGRTFEIMLNAAGLDLAKGVIPFRSPFIDVAALLLWIAGLAGCALALRHWRNPDASFFLAILTLAALAMVLREKLVYHYHLGLPAVLLAALAPEALGRVPRPAARRVAGVAAAVALIVSSVNVLCLSRDLDLRYQDFVMREADRRTPPDGVVLDPVGWAIRRAPAYRYWFVPSLVHVMVAMGRMEPYRPADLLRRPPSVVLSNERTAYWFSSNPELGRLVVSHYAPLLPNLWIPAPNGVIEPGHSMRWTVLSDGGYTIYASPLLAKHPWFRQPLVALRRNIDDLQIELRPFAAQSFAQLHWRVDGRDVSPQTGTLSLRQGQSLEVASTSADPLGVFVVDSREPLLFQAKGERELDGLSPIRFHAPFR
jgi:hypothetical protein